VRKRRRGSHWIGCRGKAQPGSETDHHLAVVVQDGGVGTSADAGLPQADDVPFHGLLHGVALGRPAHRAEDVEFVGRHVETCGECALVSARLP
jgi:hypothetical protein